MATGAARDVRFVPGKLVMNPTDLTAAYPYGGTELGLTAAVLFKPGIMSRQHGAEEWGGTVVESTFTGQVALISCVLRSFDKDALAKVFPNTATGDQTGRVGLDGRVSASANLPGYRMSNKAVKLLWVPDDLVENEAILIYNAIPGVDEAAELALSINVEFGTPVFFLASVDSQKRICKVAPLEDLVL